MPEPIEKQPIWLILYLSRINKSFKNEKKKTYTVFKGKAYLPAPICRMVGARSTGACAGMVDHILKQCFVSHCQYNFETGSKL